MPVIVRKAKSLIRYRQRRDRILPFSAAAPGGPIALVQSVSKIANDVNNTTQSFTPTAGNLIVLTHVHYTPIAALISTPIDTLGNTYVPAVAEQAAPAGLVKLRSFYAENCIGGFDTVTFDIAGTATTNSELAVVISEWSGVKSSGALDVISSNAATSAAVSTGNITPSVANCLLYAGMTYQANNVAAAEEAGWTRLEQQIPASSISAITMWKLQTAALLEDGDWTLAGSVPYISHVLAFQPAAIVSGSGIVRQMMLQ